MPEDCREKILSEEYFDIITDYPVRPEEEARLDLCTVSVEEFYRILYLNREEVADPDAYFFSHGNMPKLYGLMQETGEFSFDPNPLIVSGITQIQREPLGLTGRGCVIVFIDTGIDYTAPVFRNADGSSRILAIWDQTVQTGTPPQGFLYGSEYTRVQINEALQAEDPYTVVPTRDEDGHGTGLAAVAAGSRLRGGLEYLGAAPEADIVVVKLKECKRYFREFYLIPETVPAFQENDIMLAVRYGEGFADIFRRPVVFCLGIGTSYGDHAGSSALSRYLDAVAVRRSRAVVVCGGNEGNAAHHYQGNLRISGNAGAAEEVAEVRVGENAAGFCMQIWGGIPDTVTVSVRSPGGETIPAIRLGLQDILTYGFIYERTRITVAGEIVEPASGKELITLRVQDPTPGVWSFTVGSVGAVSNGRFHIWLPITQFLNTEVYFLEPSPYITLTEPAMAASVIAVTAYNASDNSFYIRSGRGFSGDDRIRPDLAAPGGDISVPDGKDTGSSLAAAVTAGAAAQFMQWAVIEGNAPFAESREIRNYFIRGASRSSGLSYPNREWGYGRLNLAGTFDALIGV